MTATNMTWLAPLALILAMWGLFILILARPKGKTRAVALNRRFEHAFGDDLNLIDNPPSSNWVESIGSRIVRGHSTTDSEVKLFLAQAGWKRKSNLAMFYGLQTLALIVAVPAAGYGLSLDGVDQKDWGLLFLIGCTVLLLPKRILAYLAGARRERIAQQTPILVHLLQVLLGTGLSIEQALRSLSVETQSLLPDLAEELVYILRRVEAGEDLAYTLTDTARQLDVPSLTDLAMILEQTWRMGGSVLKSLTELSALIESRMQTDLKEKINKLSAKMTVVMMLFLFPALMVLLAAPGFMGIIQGLKHVSG